MAKRETRIATYRTLEGKAKAAYGNIIRNCKSRRHPLPSYDKEFFVDFLINNNKFIQLHSEWVNSNFDKKLAPSVDRLDDYQAYELNNIRIVTWEENQQKAYSDERNGINLKKARAVDQLSLAGDFIQKFPSQKLAAASLGISNKMIHKVCNGHRKSTGGFKWRYSNEQ